MEMKQISETTLKITISLQDLEERGMEVRDFLIPQEKTEEFFYTVMDELDLPENFKNSGMLSFRVTPKKDRVDVFVTKSELNSELNFEELSDLDLNEMSGMTPEEFFKTLEQGMLTKGDAKAHAQLEAVEKASEEREEAEQLDYTHYVLDFPDLKSVVAFAHTVSFAIEASELFKHQNTYHMTILIDLINKPSYYANIVYARLLEHASQGTRTRSYLLEHGLPLILDDAVTALKRVELV